LDEHRLAVDLQKIGDHFIDAIPGRNREGKTHDMISPLSFPEWDE